STTPLTGRCPNPPGSCRFARRPGLRPRSAPWSRSRSPPMPPAPPAASCSRVPGLDDVAGLVAQRVAHLHEVLADLVLERHLRRRGRDEPQPDADEPAPDGGDPGRQTQA